MRKGELGLPILGYGLKEMAEFDPKSVEAWLNFQPDQLIC